MLWRRTCRDARQKTVNDWREFHARTLTQSELASKRRFNRMHARQLLHRPIASYLRPPFNRMHARQLLLHQIEVLPRDDRRHGDRDPLLRWPSFVRQAAADRLER